MAAGVGSMEPSDEVLRGLVSAAPDALLAVDSAGTIVYANEQAEILFDWPPGSLAGREVEALVPNRFVARHPGLRAGYVAHAVRRPMGAGLELWARRRDGSEFPAEISLSAIPVPDGLLVAAAVRDVTDRRVLEAERREQALAAQREQSHRLEALGQLAGGIAHDFNNLLGVIISYAALLARTIESDQDRADLDEIRSAAERGAGLTKQLLTFARRDVTNPETLAVNDIVTGVVSMLGRTLGEQIELQLALSPEPLFARADRHQLEQIVLNLAINARDAMPDGGRLAISTGAEVASGASAPEAMVVIRVEDSGTGMGEEVMARAFEPFFTTKPLGQGTGLGLATVYGITAQHGGDLTLNSEIGKGTTVVVRLPAAAPAEEDPAPDPLGGAGRAERVLLVEDEAALRIGTARLLEANGYVVMAASDGAEALELLTTTDLAVDVVVTDMVMPRMKGSELARRLEELGRHLPVIFMSGYDSGDVALLSGPVLVKPVDEQELLAAVRTALGNA